MFTTAVKILLVIALVLSIIIPFGIYLIGEETADASRHPWRSTYSSSSESCWSRPS
jgi:ABC-type transport system involved in cytochrome bd biosynthesis fused ATPase/permease subunit